jgi:predicted nucleic acid-binding protein
MRKPESATRAYLPNTNVFISAIKDPLKQTATLRLILHLIGDPHISLVGDDLLVEEMARYAELLRSETAATILHALIAKMEIVKVQEKFIKICRSYIGTLDRADILHAATCLQTDATLITKNRHFDRIKKEGIIRVTSVADALINFTDETQP